VLIFLTMCMKKAIVLGVLCEGTIIFLTLLLFNFLLSTHINQPKLNLNFKFTFNFATIYLFEVLVESVKTNKQKEVIVDGFKKSCMKCSN